MTIERLNELKDKYQKESDYFGNIGFTILQTKFQDVVNILNEIENDERLRVVEAAQEKKEETNEA